MEEPSCLKLYRDGRLQARMEEGISGLASCTLCPRSCGVNRLNEETGYCGIGRKAKVAAFSAHFGEESPLVGRGGSGTIFFSSCNLGCNFCQNYEISHLREGEKTDAGELAAMMIHLQEKGCHNINFVTPSHMVPQILEALVPAVESGLNVPLVYNCGGYESLETLRLLDGVFDIYMPDFKFWDDRAALRFCEAPGYRKAAMTALKEMHRQVGDLVVDENGIAIRGLLVRHLVMPGNIAGTDGIMEFIGKEISPQTYVNVMDQYRPCGEAASDATICRRLTAREYADARKAAVNAGLTRLDERDRIRIRFGM